jgi:hypothetical protein
MQNLITAIRNTNINKYPNAELNNRLVFATRGEYNDVKTGDILDVSYEWVDNVQTDNKLDGTCACKIIDAQMLDDKDDDELAALIKAAIAKCNGYGKNLLLVYGIDTQACVNDSWSNEVVIDDCTVLEVI